MQHSVRFCWHRRETDKLTVGRFFVGKKEVLMLLFSSVFILSMQTGCRRKPDIGDPEVAESLLQKCGERMQVEFPASTRVLGFAEGAQLQSWVYFLKIEIDGKDLQSLIDNSPFAGKGFLRVSQLSTGPEKWWNDHESVKNLASQQITLQPRGSGWLTILIDLDNQENNLVYLEFSGKPIQFR